MSVWDDPELKTTDDYAKLEQVGDVIEGEILVVRKHTFDDGSTAPQIILRTPTGDERTWTAGQIQAQRQLAELRPEAGDHIRAELVQIEKRSGGRTLKHIKVEVPRRGGVPTAPAPAPQAAQHMAAPLATAATAYDQGDATRQAALTQAALAAPAPAAPVAGPAIPPAPTGVDPVAWAAMDETRRQNVLAALGLTTEAVPF